MVILNSGFEFLGLISPVLTLIAAGGGFCLGYGYCQHRMRAAEKRKREIADEVARQVAEKSQSGE